MYCQVAVNASFFNSILTYHYDDNQFTLSKGDLVTVPLGKSRKEKGCVVKCQLQKSQLPEEVQKIDLKSIIEISSEDISFSEKDLSLYEWMAKYYHYYLGKLIFDTLPPKKESKKELTAYQGKGQGLTFKLNSHQKEILSPIKDKLFQGFSKHLIHGITGSGKTAIYIKLMEEVIKDNKSALFLVPEINLTPQFIETLQDAFSVPLYVYHSAVKPREKYGLWKLLQEDDGPKVILGVRSSIFLPIKKLGLIIVDEEHDQSFKQDDRCTFHARDVAVKKSLIHNIPVVLGSATPAIETYYQYTKDKNIFSLTERALNSILPEMIIMDTSGINRKKNDEAETIWPLSPHSITAIQEALHKKEQVLLLVNRLGHATFIQCRGCGHQFKCLNCSTSLKYFKYKNLLSCAHCDYSIPKPTECPECQCLTLVNKGFGTEKIAEVLTDAFPKHNIDRFDRDEIKTFKQLKTKLDLFHSGKIDIMVGTQMLSKGHNFKRVNLVIILGMDSQLNFSDFRASEKAYQLITQVAGRSGRFGEKAKVVIQTLNPNHDLYSYIKNHNLIDFYKSELEIRSDLNYPPFSRLISIHITTKTKNKTEGEATKIANICNSLLKHFPNVSVLGPKPASIEKRVNQFTWSILLRSSEINQLHNLLNSLKKSYKVPSGVNLKTDVDPQLFL